MKTKIFLVLIYALLFGTGHAPQQIDYTAPVNKLVPDPSFMQNADWNHMFYDASQNTEAGRAGLDKQIVIGPDERVYISDRSNFTISIYNSDGKFIKSFGKQGYGNGEFVNNQDLNGILNDKLLVMSDNQGRINFFDLNGNFVKLLTIDFMPLDIFPLKSGNLMVWGHVPVTGGKSKHVLAELDYKTGNYEVFDEKTSVFNTPDKIQMPHKGGMIIVGAPYSHGKEMIRVTAADRVIKANNKTGKIEVFEKQGGKYRKSSFAIEGKSIPISEKEKQEYYRDFKEKLRSRHMDTSYAEQILQEDFFPEHLPYFYNLLIDERSNVLLFIYTNKEGEDFAFEAYSTDGRKLGSSEFKIDGYDLLSNMGNFKFEDGYVYTLALKKGAEFPLRILKCRVGE